MQAWFNLSTISNLVESKACTSYNFAACMKVSVSGPVRCVTEPLLLHASDDYHLRLTNGTSWTDDGEQQQRGAPLYTGRS